MQTYPLLLTAAVPALSINIEGRGFWYASGPETGERRIIVRPETGNEIELKPGQSFKMTSDVSRWFVRSYDGTSEIAGTLNIGSGDFDDNNIFSTVKISSADGPIITTEGPMAYTKAANSFSTDTAAKALVTAAENVNGAIIEYASIEAAAVGASNWAGSIIARATSPGASYVVDDVILSYMLYSATGAVAKEFKELKRPVKIAAGKGIWSVDNNAGVSVFKKVLVTLL